MITREATTEATATPPVKLRISQSLMRDWFKCKYRFKLIQVDRLVRRRPTRPLQLGTLIHVGLAAALMLFTQHGANAPISAYRETVTGAIEGEHEEFERKIEAFIDDAWKEEARTRMQEAVIITMRAVEWLRLPYDDCLWETVCLPDGTPLIEHEMLHELLHEIDIGGALDWVARRKDTGYVYLLDFKTRDQMQQAEFDVRQVQAPIYMYLLAKKYGIELTGTATVQIRRAIPDEPTINKTKKKFESRPGMSRSSIMSDWETYSAALVRNGYDPKDYLDMKEKLKPFFSISYNPRTWREVEQTIRDAILVGDEVQVFIEKYKNPDRYSQGHERPIRSRYPMNCRDCDMEPLCSADLYGHDVDFLRRSEYMNADNPEFISVDFEEDENATLA